MNDIIIAVLGSVTTILTAIITGLFAKREIDKTEKNIPEQIKINYRKSRKSAIRKIISVVTFFVGIIIAFLCISIKNRWETSNKLEQISKVNNELILKAIKKSDGNPYLIPSLVMNVEIEEISDSVGTHLEANYTIIYNTVYLKSITNNKRAFDESFRSNRGGEVIQLSGSDKQVVTAESPTSKAWNSIFQTNIGDNRMTVTRLKVIYPKDVLDYNSKFFGRLTSKEEEFAYPNYAKDIIGEVVIIVSSKSLKLKLSELHNAAIGSLEDLNPSKWIEPTVTHYNIKDKIETTIVARFPGLEEMEVAKLKVSWGN